MNQTAQNPHTAIFAVKRIATAGVLAGALGLAALGVGIVLSRMAGLRARELFVILLIFVAISWLANKRSPRIGYLGCLGSVLLSGACLESLHRPGSPPRTPTWPPG